MERHGKHTPISIPKWDIALEALVNDEYKRLGRPLTLEDFRRLGQVHQIRLHDIMATVHQLERHGKWRHEGRDGSGQPVADHALEGLYSHGRLDEDTAEKYAVAWARQ